MTSGPDRPLDLTTLVQGLGDAVVAADAGGRIVLANAAAGRLIGAAPPDLVGRPVTSLIPPRLRSAHLTAFGHFVATGKSRLVDQAPIQVRALRADGTEVDVDLALGAVGAPGDPGFVVVASLRDVADRVFLERQVRAVRYLEAAIDVAAGLQSASSIDQAYATVLPTLCSHLDWDVAGLWLVDDDQQRLTCADVWRVSSRATAPFEAASRAARFARGEGLAGQCWAVARPLATRVPGPSAEPRQQALRVSGLRAGLAFPLVGQSGVVGVVEMFAGGDDPGDGQLLEVLASIGRQLGQFLDRMHAEDRLRSAERAQAFLLSAYTALAGATDYPDTLRRLAAVAVPTLADLCLIDVKAPGGVDRMVALHADPARDSLVRELAERYPPAAGSSHPGNAVMADGQPRWSDTISDDFLEATTRDSRHLELVKALTLTSYMSIPLLADGEVLGAITLVSSGSGRRFSAGDLALPRELAARVSTVVAAARRHDRQHQLAHQLQSLLLPDRLPQIPEMDIAVRYLTGTPGAEAGGDFYDLVQLPSARLGLMIGDVEGHDSIAAATMGQLRSASRALAGQVREPCHVVDALRWSWDLLGFERTATAVFCRIDPSSGDVVMSTAGHPPPVLLDVAGHAQFLDLDPSPILGAPGPPATQQQRILRVGETLFFYTDGLIERRDRSLLDGLQELVTVLGTTHPTTLEELCGTVLARMTPGGRREDDVAIVAVQRRLESTERQLGTRVTGVRR